MTGGIYTYTKEAFGRDHAFISSWFLCLLYLTIVFLNGTALFFVVRTLMGERAMSDPAHASIPILAMTSNAFKEDEEAAMEAGMQAHIAKPIDVNVMMKALASVLK